jgi:hypothetical protein
MDRCEGEWYASDNNLRGTPRGRRKKPTVGREPTGRLSTAVLCRCLEKNGMVRAWHGRSMASVNRPLRFRDPIQTHQHSADSFGWESHNTHTRQTSIVAEGFEPAFPANERLHSYALDRAANGLGSTIPAFDSEILGTQICLLLFTQTSCNPDGNPVTFSLRQFAYLSLKLLFVTCDWHLETDILVFGTRYLEIVVVERVVAMKYVLHFAGAFVTMQGNTWKNNTLTCFQKLMEQAQDNRHYLKGRRLFRDEDAGGPFWWQILR